MTRLQPLSAADRQILELVLVRLDAADLQGSQQAILTLSPAAMTHPEALFVAARLLMAQGRLEDAERTFAAIVQLAPHDHSSRHNHASALRQMDRFKEALAETDIIIKSAKPRVESLTLRAHILAELGRFDEAVQQYQRALAVDPTYLDAQETLSRLRPQIGQADEALDEYRVALNARPNDQPLWQSAISAAKDLKQGAQMVDWCNQYAKLHGEDGFAGFARALGQSLSGDQASAISTLRQLAKTYEGDPGVRNHLAPLLIAEGEWDEAEKWALEASQLAPDDQSAWAWLSIIWRLKGDVREDWLADYDRLVMPVDLPLEATELSTLVGVLEPMHKTSAHPVEQSPRGGTQTRGLLFERRVPEIQRLATLIKKSVQERLGQVTLQADHPFLSRLTGNVTFAGSWSVRLASEGHHSNHIHHAGWLSSALYVDLPEEVASADGNAGALAFGVPDETLGLDLSPRRIVQPAVGRLVIFPSYFWHGTIPFESKSHRLTVAFDALPR